MCHQSVLDFGSKMLLPEIVTGKRVLDVGALDINGSLRDLLYERKCAEYIGVDIVEGACVDLVVDVCDLVMAFGVNSFDIVISTEMLEHAKHWRTAVSNMKQVCKEGGYILITTRSPGFPYHPSPGDYWRFTITNAVDMFGDCKILTLEVDPLAPGFLLFVYKPAGFIELDLSTIEVKAVTESKLSHETEMDIVRIWGGRQT